MISRRCVSASASFASDTKSAPLHDPEGLNGALIFESIGNIFIGPIKQCTLHAATAELGPSSGWQKINLHRHDDDQGCRNVLCFWP